jgi:glycolate oxidase
MPHAMGVTLSLAKFNRIVRVDPVSRKALFDSDNLSKVGR